MPTKNNILVTGGAGFIGSYLVDRLIEEENKITIFDNLSSGKIGFIEKHLKNTDFTLIKGDILDHEVIERACRDIDLVCHVAANPDVRLGASDTKIHFDQNILATYNLLEAMRKNNVKKVVFTSTSTIYGEAQIMPTPENYGPLIPISLYGASKLACEALVTSYSHTFDMQAWIFRFANIVALVALMGLLLILSENYGKSYAAGNFGRWSAGKVLFACIRMRQFDVVCNRKKQRRCEYFQYWIRGYYQFYWNRKSDCGRNGTF